MIGLGPCGHREAVCVIGNYWECKVCDSQPATKLAECDKKWWTIYCNTNMVDYLMGKGWPLEQIGRNYYSEAEHKFRVSLSIESVIINFDDDINNDKKIGIMNAIMKEAAFFCRDHGVLPVATDNEIHLYRQ